MRATFDGPADLHVVTDVLVHTGPADRGGGDAVTRLHPEGQHDDLAI